MHGMRTAIVSLCLVMPMGPLRADTADPLAFRVPTQTGQQVSMKGYLYFDFENKNLYRTSRWEDARDADCVPIDMWAKDKQVLKAARRLNHAYVLVRGKTMDFRVAPPGQEVVDLEHCGNIGLMLESIEPARKN